MSGITGQLFGPSVDEKATLSITADHHADPVQPPLPYGLPPAHHSQRLVLGIDAFHEFIHATYGPRHH